MSDSRVIPFAGCFTTDGRSSTPWVFIGIADDTQSSYLRGAADAPQTIRRAYDGRCFNSTTELGANLERSVVDAGDLHPLGSWNASAESYREKLRELVRAGKTPFVAGGDHAVTVPVVEALDVLPTPVHVVQIDAHPDLYPDFENNPDSHACTGARLLEMDHVADVTQLGIRTLNDEQRRSQERFAGRLRIYEARSTPGRPPTLAHIPKGASVYITVDMDGFDPAFAPGVSHPVPGGLSPRQVLALVHEGHWTLVGMDVVEVNPSRDFQFQTAILAARLLHEGMGFAAHGRSD
jgi:agmatinase